VKKIVVRLGKKSYSILIKPGILNNVSEIIDKLHPSVPVAIISDSIVSGLYGKKLKADLQKTRKDVHLIKFPSGESSKNHEQLKLLYTELIKKKMTRNSVIIALGGGVTGDLAGFAAATYLRGINFIQIPTTLLAQVDSSVGGKVGINHELGKNLIGSFYQPKIVIIDPHVLSTLPAREVVTGMGEVVKYGLIADKNLFLLIDKNLDSLLEINNQKLISDIIYRCCRIKAQIVEKDEKENNIRKILNFGHTFGHALEQVTDYKVYTHGEAVIAGMRWAVFYSYEKGLLNSQHYAEIDKVLGRFGIKVGNINTDSILSAMSVDKKISDNQLFLILLKNAGKTLFYKVKDNKELKFVTERWINSAAQKNHINY